MSIFSVQEELAIQLVEKRKREEGTLHNTELTVFVYLSACRWVNEFMYVCVCVYLHGCNYVWLYIHVCISILE